MAFSALDWIVLTTYLVGMVGIGFYFSSRQAGPRFLMGLLISVVWPAKAEGISRIKSFTIFGAKVIADTAHRANAIANKG